MFFDYQCRYGHTDIKPNETVVGLVLDASQEFVVETAVSIRADGVQTAMLRIAGTDGGFIVPAKTATGKGDQLRSDDVVLWVPRFKGVPFQNDDRSAWVGVIVATVALEIDPYHPEFRIRCKYA